MPEEGRDIVVTGVSRGLGLALSEGFIAAGHRVHGCARSTDAIEALQDRWPDPHSFRVVDVSSDRAVKEWTGDLLRKLDSPPSLIVNNAGIINRSAALWELSSEEFDSVIDVNIKGVANVLRHFLPALIGRGRGVIVNLSSGWGRSTSPEVSAYCATKWAIEGLTASLASELPDGLAAIALNPGIIDTEMLRTCFGDSAAAYPGPDVWAQAAVPYLLELGPQHSGQELTVP